MDSTFYDKKEYTEAELKILIEIGAEESDIGI